MVQEYFGVIGFDNGNNDEMESRQTRPASLLVIADWFNSVVEYHEGELRYNPDCKWTEISVSIYYADGPMTTVETEPVEHKVMRRIYV